MSNGELAVSGFVIWTSFVISHSEFVIF